MPYAIRLLFALLIAGYYYLPTNRSFADDQVVILTEDGESMAPWRRTKSW